MTLAGGMSRLSYSSRFEDHVLTGDFDGDGRDSTTSVSVPSGYTGYSPLTGDFDGDGDVEIAWTKASSAGLYFYLDGSARTVSSGNYDGYTPQTGDFDGDGRSDIVWTKAYNGGRATRVALGSSLAPTSTTRTRSTTGSSTKSRVSPRQCSYCIPPPPPPSPPPRPPSTDYRGYEAQVGDFNGDGLSDLVWSKAYNGGIKAYVTLGDGSGGFGAATLKTVKSTGNYTGYEARVVDLNGDGLSDMVWMKGLNGGLRAYAVLGEGDGSFASTQYSAPRTSGNYDDYEPLAGDFNGDGLADLAWVNKSNSNRNVYVSLGTGTGLFQTAQYNYGRSLSSEVGTQYSSFSVNHTQATAADYNGDGIAEIVWRSWVSYRETYTSTYTSHSPLICQDHYGYFHAPCEITTTGTRTVNFWARHYAEGVAPADYGRVSGISSGNGSTFSLDYASLSDSASGIYTKDSGAELCSLPCRDMRAPIQVVKEVVQNHGDGLTERITYQYGGAKVDLAGRGFKGFRWMESTDTRTGIISRTMYRQDFPYIGQIKSSSRYVGSSSKTHLSTETNTWSSRSLNGGKTKFPYLSSSTAKTYELEDGVGNSAVTTVTNASVYDSYGNPTSITVTTTGAGGTYRKVTTNTYTNTTSNWHLGRLTCATVRSEAPGETAVTRTSGFAYDATTGLLTKEVVEPGSGDVSGCVSVLPASELENITLTTVVPV